MPPGRPSRAARITARLAWTTTVQAEDREEQHGRPFQDRAGIVVHPGAEQAEEVRVGGHEGERLEIGVRGQVGEGVQRRVRSDQVEQPFEAREGGGGRRPSRPRCARPGSRPRTAPGRPA